MDVESNNACSRAGTASVAGVAGCLACTLIVMAIVSLAASLHSVEEGHVGVYYRGGALLETYSMPGYSTMMPFLASMEEVSTMLHTDKIDNVPCGTR